MAPNAAPPGAGRAMGRMVLRGPGPFRPAGGGGIRIPRPERPGSCVASSTATASARVCASILPSRLWTWFLTVDTPSSSRAAISLLERPFDEQRADLALARGQLGMRRRPATLGARLGDAAQERRGHPRRAAELAARRGLDRVQQVVEAGPPRDDPHRAVLGPRDDVLVVLADGQRDDGRRGRGVDEGPRGGHVVDPGEIEDDDVERLACELRKRVVTGRDHRDAGDRVQLRERIGDAVRVEPDRRDQQDADARCAHRCRSSQQSGRAVKRHMTPEPPGGGGDTRRIRERGVRLLVASPPSKESRCQIAPSG